MAVIDNCWSRHSRLRSLPMRRRTEDSSQIQIPGTDEVPEIKSVKDLTSDDVERLKRVRPKKLGIVCSRAECNEGLHCFRPEVRAVVETDLHCQHCGHGLLNFKQ